MKIAIRVDSSTKIGSGHLFRCLTLAEALKKRGCSVDFITRNLSGNLIFYLKERQFAVHVLNKSNKHTIESFDRKYAGDETYWLGVSQFDDAIECKPILSKLEVDWLVVDQYGIDHVWERHLAGLYGKLMVIDDLANRVHICDLLLDQTYSRSASEYEKLVPRESVKLLGSEFAMLRPSFNDWREYSLKRRSSFILRRLLVFMGGSDPDNYTRSVLKALNSSKLPDDVLIEVIMGSSSPHLKSVEQFARVMDKTVSVQVGVNNMAEIMAKADLAIGASGTSTWERCCLGLPTIMFMLAKNQEKVAMNLHNAGAALLISRFDQIQVSLVNMSKNSSKYSSLGSKITDGLGLSRVVKIMYREKRINDLNLEY